MNYLNIDPVNNQGGHPFSLDDLLTLVLGFTDLANAITAQHYDDYGLALLSPPKIAISGGNFTSSQFWIIYQGIGGVVRVVPTASTALSGAPGAAFHIRVTTDFGANDPVTYQSGVSKNVHAVSVGQLVHIDPSSAGGNDIPFSNFNIADWVNGAASFLLSGLDTSIVGGGYKFRYRLLSNNTMLCYLSFRGAVTSAVKVTLPLPYLVANTFTHVVFCDNPTNTESVGRIQAPADGNELSIARIGGAGYTVGAVIENNGTHFMIELKMRD